MTNNLPSKITVTVTSERELDLSSLRYAVVNPNPCDNTIYSLFRWLNRAESYVKANAPSYNIIDLKPQLPIDNR